jgi:hypothetical protein
MPSATSPSSRPTRWADAVLHLAGRLVGEGDGEDLRRIGPPGRDDMGDAGRQDAGLAGAGAGQDEHRPVECLDRLALLRVQPIEIAEPAAARLERTRRQAAGAGGGSLVRG